MGDIDYESRCLEKLWEAAPHLCCLIQEAPDLATLGHVAMLIETKLDRQSPVYELVHHVLRDAVRDRYQELMEWEIRSHARIDG